MAQQVLMIGIGGTGIRTLLHVKQQLMQNSPKHELPDNVELLGIDTEATINPIGGISAGLDDGVVYSRYGNQVTLDLTHEYIHVGGNSASIKPWVKGFQPGEKCHDWFNKDYFLGNDPATLLNLTAGAGAYRQLGRLALLWDLRNGEASNLYTQLNAKITRLVTASATNEIRVLVIGSIAGGTGASMFIDLAHLSKKMAAQVGAGGVAKTFGMLVLPEAFQWTPNVTVDNQKRAHGFSALRELKRYLTLWGDELGYEMNYTCQPMGSHPVLASRTEGAVFSMVYLFGERGQKAGRPIPAPALNVSIEKGVAPTIASWALYMTDNLSSGKFDSQLVNHTALMPAGQAKVPAVVVSTGVYSKVLPIESIIQRYELKLGKEIVDMLLPVDAAGEFNRFRENAVEPSYKIRTGDDVAADELRTSGPKLYRDMGKLHFDYAQDAANSADVETVYNRKVCEWQDVYDPDTENNEHQLFTVLLEETSYFSRKNRGLFQNPLNGAYYEEICKKRDSGSIENAARDWKEQLEKKLRDLENQYSSAIADMKDHQVQVFRTEIQERLDRFLNGQLAAGAVREPANAQERLGGKFYWTYEYFKGLQNQLLASMSVLEAAYAKKNAELEGIEEALKGIEGEMRKKESKQVEYACKFQEKWDIHRWAMFCKGEYAAAEEALEVVTRVVSQLQQWLYVFTDQDAGGVSLLKSLDDGMTAVQNSRKQAAVLFPKVREIIDDTDWEDAQYAGRWNVPDAITGVTKADKVLHELKWRVEPVLEDGKTQYRVRIFLRKEELQTWPAQETDSAKKKEKSEKNREILAERCKQEFTQMRDELSILGYLEDKHNSGDASFAPDKVMNKMFDQCDVLLPHAGLTGTEYSAYLAVRHAPANAYATAMETRMQALYGGVNPNLYNLMDYADRSTLSFIPVVDFVPIEDIAAYQIPLGAYKGTPARCVGVGQGRELLHVFVAEEEATRLDLVNPADPNCPLIDQRVCGVLSDKNLLQNLVFALQLGVIERKSILPWMGTIAAVGGVACEHYISSFENGIDPITGGALALNVEYTETHTRYHHDIPLIDLFENVILMDHDFNTPAVPMRTVIDKMKEAVEKKFPLAMQKYLVGLNAAPQEKLSHQEVLILEHQEETTGQVYLAAATRNKLYRDFVTMLRNRRDKIAAGTITLDPAVTNQETTLITVLERLVTSWIQ